MFVKPKNEQAHQERIQPIGQHVDFHAGAELSGHT